MSTLPVADFVPAGISTWYVVACGNRITGSNSSVRVPTQRHAPGGCGVSFTGCTFAASSCDVTATIAWLNVTCSCGASGTSPSGAHRKTVRSLPLSFVVGGAALLLGGGGKLPLIVLPVRGGGCDFLRSAKSC